MAYKPKDVDAYTSMVIGQYLQVASGGNVMAVFVACESRWYLKCRKCNKSLQFQDRYELEHEYVINGTLPQSVQTFSKEHRHAEQVMVGYGIAAVDKSADIALQAVQSTIKTQHAAEAKRLVKQMQDKEPDGVSIPIPKSGRKFL